MWPVAIGFHTVSRVVPIVLLLWACDAVAAPAETALEVSTARVPGVDSLDFSVMPQNRSGMGVSFGVTTFTPTQPLFGPPGLQSHSLDLGVHWRYTLDGSYRFDVTAYRHMPSNDAMSLIESHDPGYGARVEMALGSDKLRKGFATQKAFIGLQLESGARVYLKRSGGGPMLYYRNSF